MSPNYINQNYKLKYIFHINLFLITFLLIDFLSSFFFKIENNPLTTHIVLNLLCTYYIFRHGDISNLLNTPQGRLKRNDLWLQLKNLLAQIGHGPDKSVDQWIKVGFIIIIWCH